MSHSGTILRQLMKRSCVAMPGSFNGLTSRAVAKQGFQATYVSGGALAASTGVPDIGLLSAEDFCRLISDTCTSSNLPVLADADTGFGEGEMVAKTVWAYDRAGAAGLHLEDQVFPKRCGHLDGKSLVPTREMQRKIEVAAEASHDCTGGEFIVCARTDARSVDGIESTIERSKAYIDAGADMIFPEGLENLKEFRTVADALKSHREDIFLLANMTEFGKTEHIKLADFNSAGYSCVIYPVSTLRVAMKAVDDFLETLKETESAEYAISHMLNRKELYELLKYTPGEEWIYPQQSASKH